MSLLVEINSVETDAFEEIPAGDYKFKLMPPNDPSKAESTFNKVVDEQPTNIPETRYLNWPLEVQEGEHKGRFFYHRTMIWASPEKIAESAKGSYEPAGFTIQFLDTLGLCDLDKNTNKLKLKAELFTKTKDGKTALRLDKIYGTEFMGRLALSKPYKGKQYMNLTKSWIPKATDKPKEEELF